jgi:SAM-dependent methyltransferase
MNSHSGNNQKHSTDKILLSAVAMVARKHNKRPGKHLDIGSGDGSLIRLLKEKFPLDSSGCDYTDTLMKDHSTKVAIVNLNTDKLPYSDAEFDLITCTEVIEHLEHYRETLQEAYRILNENGTLVVTTPNILNLKSRIRFLIFGFYNLFGPLHFRESALHSTGGHITPIGLFYLIHSLVDAGFEKIEIAIDKKQGTSLLWLALLYTPIKFFGWLTLEREKNKYRTIDEHNIKYVSKINSIDILTGRTIIVGCKKLQSTRSP